VCLGMGGLGPMSARPVDKWPLGHHDPAVACLPGVAPSDKASLPVRGI